MNVLKPSARSGDQHHDRDDAYRAAEDFGNVVHFLFCSGVSSFSVACMIMILLTCVPMPVLVTMARPESLRYGRAAPPCWRGCRGPSPVRGCRSLPTGTLSPVRLASAIRRLAAAKRRPSAETGGESLSPSTMMLAGHHVNRVDAFDFAAVTQHVGLRRGHAGER